LDELLLRANKIVIRRRPTMTNRLIVVLLKIIGDIGLIDK
jgi:hypothetical protein